VFIHTPVNVAAPPLARRLNDDVRAPVPDFELLPRPRRRCRWRNRPCSPPSRMTVTVADGDTLGDRTSSKVAPVSRRVWSSRARDGSGADGAEQVGESVFELGGQVGGSGDGVADLVQQGGDEQFP
jgi:hypothetical protein